MASLVAETWVYINGNDMSNGTEISKLDTALLMSLFEESNGEEYNEEQVNRVIRSLEAEINDQNMLLEGDHDLAMEPELLLSDEEDGLNCLASTDFDMEQLVGSSLSEDMNWSNYMDQCGLDLGDLVQYEIVSGGYTHRIHNIVYETDQEHGFMSSLWHETNDSVTHN